MAGKTEQPVAWPGASSGAARGLGHGAGMQQQRCPRAWTEAEGSVVSNLLHKVYHYKDYRRIPVAAARSFASSYAQGGRYFVGMHGVSRQVVHHVNVLPVPLCAEMGRPGTNVGRDMWVFLTDLEEC